MQNFSGGGDAANMKFLGGTQYFCILMLYVASKYKVLWGNAILLKGNAKTILLQAISWGNARECRVSWGKSTFASERKISQENAMQENAKVSQMQNP